MAVAGDVLIKAVFDVAQVKQGVDEANQQLNRFSNDVEGINQKLGSFASGIGNLFKGLIAIEAINQIKQFVQQVEKSVLEIDALARSYKLSTDAVQAYTRAALDAHIPQQDLFNEISNFNQGVDRAVAGNQKAIQAFKDLGVFVLDASGKQRDYNELLVESSQKLLQMGPSAAKSRAELILFGKMLPTADLKILSTSIDDLTQKYKGLIPKEVIDRMIEHNDGIKKAQLAIEAFFAPIIAAIQNAIFETIANSIKYLGTVIANLDLIKLKDLANLLLAIGTMNLPGTIAAIFGRTGGLSELDAYKERLAAINKEIQELEAGGGHFGFSEQKEQRAKALLDAYAKQAEIQAKIMQIEGTGAPEAVAPPITVKGSQPDVFKYGGGRQPGVNRIEELLDRLKRQTEVAQKATQELVDKADTPLVDLEREVDRTKKIGDMVADIESKVKSRGISRDQIVSIVTAYVGSEDDFKRMKEFSRLAEETEQKLGGGAKQRAADLDQLNKEMSTGRLSNVAYARSVKAIEDAFKQADEEVRRFKGGIDAFTAGFERAMRQWTEAHDLFSTGEQTFGLFVDAISDSLDVLLGKSSKTFGEIAAEFASMLAKMAAQAALSEIFKIAFSFLKVGLGFGTGSSAGLETGVDIPRQHGGPVSPGNWYMVGERGPERFVPSTAGRIEPAGGGNVYVNNYAGVDVATRKRSNGDLDVTIRAVRRALSRDVMRGGNEFAGALESAYSVARGGNR